MRHSILDKSHLGCYISTELCYSYHNFIKARWKQGLEKYLGIEKYFRQNLLRKLPWSQAIVDLAAPGGF